jgi:sphinganine-1-phosphate aldolase
MTSGGTESIFMAVKAAKEWARLHKQTKNPLMLLAETAHPAFCKAADTMEFNYRLIKVDADYKLDLDDLKKHLSTPCGIDSWLCTINIRKVPLILLKKWLQ